jgi:hypothetical protein
VTSLLIVQNERKCSSQSYRVFVAQSRFVSAMQSIST